MTKRNPAARFAILLVAAVFGLLPLQRDAIAQVNVDDLEERDGLLFEEGASDPYSGPVTDDRGMKGRIEEGKRVGLWVWFDGSGRKEYETMYQDGERVESRGWHTNGAVASEMQFKDGRPSGIRKAWDDSGRLIHERTYKDGVLHGDEVLRDHNGNLLYTAEYDEGRLDGEVTWWYGEGSVRWETHYDSGERVGTWRQFSPDGELLMETTWEGGQLVSRHNPHEGH